MPSNRCSPTAIGHFSALLALLFFGTLPASVLIESG